MREVCMPQETTYIPCLLLSADQETWSLSDEETAVRRMSGLIPLPQLWHKRQVKAITFLEPPCICSFQLDLVNHQKNFNQANLVKVPGSLSNTKQVFSLNQVLGYQLDHQSTLIYLGQPGCQEL